MSSVGSAVIAIPLLYGICAAGGVAVGCIGASVYDRLREKPQKRQFDEDGFDEDGFNAMGRDREGYNRRGYKDGFNRQGLDSAGYARDGFNLGGIDRAGNDRNHYVNIVNNLDNRVEGSLAQRRFDQGKLDYALLEIRVGLEEGVTNLCLHWRGDAGKDNKFASILDSIPTSKLDDELRGKLKSAYRICSQGLHYGDNQKKSVDQVTFCIYTLKELREHIAAFANVENKDV